MESVGAVTNEGGRRCVGRHGRALDGSTLENGLRGVLGSRRPQSEATVTLWTFHVRIRDSHRSDLALMLGEAFGTVQAGPPGFQRNCLVTQMALLFGELVPPFFARAVEKQNEDGKEYARQNDDQGQSSRLVKHLRFGRG